VFWLAYATERQHGCGNGWALSLDDQDVSQLLPVRGDQYEQGVSQVCFYSPATTLNCLHRFLLLLASVNGRIVEIYS